MKNCQSEICSCGCCEGTEVLTPAVLYNRPNLDTISYRVGTHAQFLESMKARLSSSDSDYAALQKLRTRDPSDFSIALLDAWAVVGDVLSFYQERLANEGYLRTATERFSVLELARLVGYAPRPGVASTVFLAYTLDAKEPMPIPKGSRAQSIPGPGELPQSFETAENLEAYPALNLLKLRLQRPQYLPLRELTTDKPVYLEGISTNLKVGDALLLHFFNESEPVLFQANNVLTEVEFNHTKLSLNRLDNTLEESQPSEGEEGESSGNSENTAAGSEQGTTEEVFPSTLAQVVNVLNKQASKPPANNLRLVRNVNNLYVKESDLVPKIYGTLFPSIKNLTYKALANVPSDTTAPLESLEKLQVKASLFGHNVPPKIITRITPADQVPLTMSANSNAPALVPEEVHLTLLEAWKDLPLNVDDSGNLDSLVLVALDSEYDQIKQDSWIAVERPPNIGATENKSVLSYHEVSKVNTRTLNAFSFSSRVTVLTLKTPWLENSSANTHDFRKLLTETRVYAAGITLEMAQEPINKFEHDITGGSSNYIELDNLYRGLEPGRWAIVQGERTDEELLKAQSKSNPDEDRSTGVFSAELVMISEVLNGVSDINGNFKSNDDKKEPPKDTSEDTSEDTSGEKPVEVEALPNDKLHTFIRLAEPLAYRYKRDTVKIYANVVKATHGETKAEVLGAGDGSKAFQTFTLKQPPLTYLASPTPEGAESTLEVFVNDVRWHEAKHFPGLEPNDRNYVIRIDDDGKTSVVFGDGQKGARLPTGLENIQTKYRSGIGKAGNVAAEQISLLASRPLGVKEVINPLPATGGADRESRDLARKNAPKAIKALDRLVSVQDYADFTQAFAGIGKASAVELSNGQRELVHVTIAGADDIPIEKSSDLYRNLVKALRNLGDPYYPLEVDMRELKLLVVEAKVHLLADYIWESVEPKIRAAMLEAFGFNNRELGQDVLSAEVLSVIQRIEGVAYVDLDKLGALGKEELASPNLVGEVKEVTPTTHRIPVEMACFKTPEEPAAEGEPPVAPTLTPAQLAILSPEVPDTLILSEVP